MSKEIVFRYLAESKVKEALLPEIVTAAFRLEHLAEEMLSGKDPGKNEARLKEIVDGCVNIRACAEKLN